MLQHTGAQAPHHPCTILQCLLWVPRSSYIFLIKQTCFVGHNFATPMTNHLETLARTRIQNVVRVIRTEPFILAISAL